MVLASGVPGLRTIVKVAPRRCTWAPTLTMYPLRWIGQLQEVESPAGGSSGLRPHTVSRVFTKSMALWPKRWPRLASEAARLHRVPVTPDGDAGRCFDDLGPVGEGT